MRHQNLITFIRHLYGQEGPIPLHAPYFGGNEKEYLLDCIETNFVSSVGPYVNRFEAMMREITGAKYAVATMNGTAALHMALILAGVKDGDEVITQPLTFVATCNAIAYQRAIPVFVDVDLDTMGLSPAALESFLEQHAELQNDSCINKTTGRRIAAVVPMHTFGHPANLAGLLKVCGRWNIPMIEDAAESLGSSYLGRHTGTFGLLGTFSFNGNKTVTSGGGGCIITDNNEIGLLAKHLTTTAKRPHPFEFFHDQIGFNYRLPNLNAALACAQLEKLSELLENKRVTARAYEQFCQTNGIKFMVEPPGTKANFWLNAVQLDNLDDRNAFLALSNGQGVMTRPIWTLMNRLPAFSQAQHGPLPNAEWLEARIVNLPSSIIPRFPAN